MSVLLLPGSRRPDLSTHGIPKFRKTTHNPESYQSTRGFLVTASDKIVTGIAEPVMNVSKAIRSARKYFSCAVRSEEHTSELQSLMHISYAVFCLQKHI